MNHENTAKLLVLHKKRTSERLIEKLLQIDGNLFKKCIDSFPLQACRLED